TMFLHSTKNKNANKFFISEDCFPQTIDVMNTRAVPQGIELVIGDYNSLELTEEYFGMLLQYPHGKGEAYNYTEIIESAHNKNIFVVVAADLLSLALLTPPGEFGADVVVGNTQRFGVPMGFGGPHAAFFSAKDEFKRIIPGRIIGASVDVHGNTAFRMALQTREQHIRREKATSNICTAQVLLAVMAGMYGVYHGQKGLKEIAERTHKLAKLIELSLMELGFEQSNKNYFDTLFISIKDKQQINKIREIALKKEINFRYFDSAIGIAVNEVTDYNDAVEVIGVFAEALGKQNNLKKIEKIAENLTVDYPDSLRRKSQYLQHKVFNSYHSETEMMRYLKRIENIAENLTVDYPESLKRKSQYLQHKVFNSYHSETEMMRYLKRLENKDLSLVHSMIALGSCTMKLNAATEMQGVTFHEFGNIHPFAPSDQTDGYKEIFSELEKDLCKITGFDAVSLQPNSGAQGEYAGLMVIREYHKSRNDVERNVAIIPASAHGTNPASAVMAGMKVVVVNSTPQGNVDIEDLKKKVETNKKNLAAFMITYPSTHGVFEEDILEICDIIHKNGGLVYMDGANMNAQVGLTSPARIGADVCHLNLHKTFCIPHGGGGPGMGPIAVAKHLVPFLPNHSVVDLKHDKGITSVSSAPWGSASILIISYAYIKMMGDKGLTDATKLAILNANYLKAKLESQFKVLYSGKKGRVAHELIFDMRQFKTSAGIEVEDIAKRLMDYGYHAPTVSFPVPGTLMVEPTESESKFELDRFCDALLSIREEIKEIETGIADLHDNALKNSPHTLQSVIKDDWTHSYSREKAVYPVEWVKTFKFWPTVGRINSALGDRNLICSCNLISDYIEEPVSN
ncbi:MAG TPA: aminomethyl-transferring glycine dehydrogenase subunit GcvPB, partial [Ignavibacteriaceae bacterium]|nr:aminomethyl-transferring glycine dehydrogenase subunit GcvPB [Ignavibacteriaceae bacterium]